MAGDVESIEKGSAPFQLGLTNDNRTGQALTSYHENGHEMGRVLTSYDENGHETGRAPTSYDDHETGRASHNENTIQTGYFALATEKHPQRGSSTPEHDTTCTIALRTDSEPTPIYRNRSI